MREELIRVQAGWAAWQSAEVRLDDLENIHWARPSGAPQPLLYGYVSCANVVRGDIPHGCAPFDAPHRLLVCVLKKHLVPSAYVELARRGSVEIGRREEERRRCDAHARARGDEHRPASRPSGR